MTIKLGSPLQLAYVVKDMDTSLDHWRQLGAGPFYVASHIQYESQAYLGADADIQISAALGYLGEVQIELIQQHNDAPSVFTDFISKFGYGLQHIGYLCDRFDALQTELIAAGYQLSQSMKDVAGNETIFLESSGEPGTCIELIRSNAHIVQAFSQLKADAAQRIDG